MKFFLLFFLTIKLSFANNINENYLNFLNTTSNLTDLKKIEEVNKYFNKYKYTSDIEQFEKKDYWMSLNEFLVYKKGDCEDFAIAKYFTLKKLGLDINKLNIVYGYIKTKENDMMPHMLLTYNDKNDIYILDNYNKNFRRYNKKIENFKAVYSFNEKNLYTNIEYSLNNKNFLSENKLEKFKNLKNNNDFLYYVKN